MFKYEANVKPGAVMMQAAGTLETVTGEATYLIHKLYASETSPIWEVDE